MKSIHTRQLEAFALALRGEDKGLFYRWLYDGASTFSNSDKEVLQRLANRVRHTITG